MTNLFLIAADACGGMLPLVRVVVKLVKVLMILIPIALIVYGTFDLGKAVIASDEKEVKAAQSRLIKRFIYAALVFFVPVIVYAVMNVLAAGAGDEDGTFDPGETDNWADCWNAAKSS